LDKMFKEIDAMNQSQKTSKASPKPAEDMDDEIPF
jgi:hypothetical protein